MNSHDRVLPSIQILRAVAAVLVLVHHTQLNVTLGFGLPGALPALPIGSAGVDIFFVISGFVMVVSTWNGFQAGRGGGFLLRRCIRIVPLYWAATAFYVVTGRFVPGIPGAPYTAQTIASSFLFWPQMRADGAIQPIDVVGWTLNYEMFFYVLFAAALVAPRRWAIGSLMAALATIVAAGAMLRPSAAPLAFWSDPIVLEFALGMALGAIYRSGLRLPPVGALCLGAVAVAAALGGPSGIPDGFLRLAAWGFPAAGLVGALVLGRVEEHLGRARPLVALGDASYALYLVHLPVLWVIRLAAWRFGLQPTGAPGAWLYAGIGVVACVASAVLVHYPFERPVTGWLKRALVRRSDPARAADFSVPAAASKTAAV